MISLSEATDPLEAKRVIEAGEARDAGPLGKGDVTYETRGYNLCIPMLYRIHGDITPKKYQETYGDVTAMQVETWRINSKHGIVQPAVA